MRRVTGEKDGSAVKGEKGREKGCTGENGSDLKRRRERKEGHAHGAMDGRVEGGE